MKKVEAIIKPFKLEEVKEALTELGITGMTISEVKGYGRQKGHLELYGGSEYRITFLPKVRLEMMFEDDRLDEVLATIEQRARTRRIGDGKIFVQSVDAPGDDSGGGQSD